MNVRAFVGATCIGTAFFAAGYAWNYQPEIINANEIWSMFESEHGKARAAVLRVLIAPNSAHFNGLRTIDANQAKYVCGSVKAMDKERQYVEAAFVYTIAIDFARIDDDGRMTSQRSPYRPCPSAADDKSRPEHADIARRAVDDQDRRKNHPQVQRRNDGTAAWPARRTDSGGRARFGGPAEIGRLIGFGSLSRGRMGARSAAFRFGRGGTTSR